MSEQQTEPTPPTEAPPTVPVPLTADETAAQSQFSAGPADTSIAATQTKAVDKPPQVLHETTFGFEPHNMRELVQFANYLAKSSLIPKALQGRPADVVLVLMKGRELRISATQALAEINVIDGKAGISALLMVGLIRRSGLCAYWRVTESTDKIATIETLRRGAPAPVVVSYTIEQAARAGLTNKSNWKNDPVAMLQHRAETRLGKREYQEVVIGLYTEDELDDLVRDAAADPVYRAAETAAVEGIVASAAKRDPLKERLENRAKERAPAAEFGFDPDEVVCPTCEELIDRRVGCTKCKSKKKG